MPHALLSLDTPVVIAHRGGGRLRPENTLVAFDHAVALGADALECDVHVSKSGEVVVIHDDTVDRTTNARGAVAAYTARELQQMDAGWSFVDLQGRTSFRQQGIGVPRLEDALRRFPTTPFVIEIKGDDPAIVPHVLDVIARHRRGRDVVLGGFNHGVLAAVRAQAADLVTSASIDEVRSAVRRAWCGLSPRATGCRLFQMPVRYHGRRILRRHLTRAIRRASLPVHAWVVDDPAEMRQLLDWGVTGIITDRPDLAREAILARR
jgi:glycerophosphoryl diester phosphodiesterase